MTAFTIYKPSLLSAAIACLFSTSVQASTCITAGRMDKAVWAPQFQSVRLLDDAGRNLTVKNKSELTQVRAVELTEAALLSVCDGNKPVDLYAVGQLCAWHTRCTGNRSAGQRVLVVKLLYRALLRAKARVSPLIDG